jgi:hypothetical protein
LLKHQGARTKVVFRFELAKEFQAFYGGLRLGKMSKIKKAYAVNIELKPSGDYNFAIELSGPDRSTIDGFNAALEELPAQISFHIPEMYHRRIIGASGSNIQSIMSRFQCFIKCCSPEEQAALGGYNESQDNVLIYCPARNRGNIELAKQALMEMVAPEVGRPGHELQVTILTYRTGIIPPDQSRSTGTTTTCSPLRTRCYCKTLLVELAHLSDSHTRRLAVIP